MKVTELRIGNYIILGTRNQVTVMVEEILEGNFVTCNLTTNEWPITDYKPVPITPEWLARFGFKEVKTHAYMKGDFGLEYFTHEGRFFSDNVEHLNQAPVNFIHQLQNLYFALTGEELE